MSVLFKIFPSIPSFHAKFFQRQYEIYEIAIKI